MLRKEKMCKRSFSPTRRVKLEEEVLVDGGMYVCVCVMEEDIIYKL
jgi:hypothetical protein